MIKNRYNYLVAKLQAFREDDQRDFRLVQNIRMGESNFNHFLWLRNQLVLAAENFGGDQKFSPIQVKTMSRDTEEQLKVVHELVVVVDSPYRKIFVTLLQINVDKKGSSCAQIRIIAIKNEEEIFQLIVCVKYTLEDFNYYLNLENSVNDKVYDKLIEQFVLSSKSNCDYLISIIFFS